MSVSVRFEYRLKGKSDDLAKFVQKHTSDGCFCPETLGIDYPEEMDLEKCDNPQDITDHNLKEIRILFSIVYRRHFSNSSVQDDIYEEISKQYPNLEVEYFVNDPYL